MQTFFKIRKQGKKIQVYQILNFKITQIFEKKQQCKKIEILELYF